MNECICFIQERKYTHREKEDPEHGNENVFFEILDTAFHVCIYEGFLTPISMILTRILFPGYIVV